MSAFAGTVAAVVTGNLASGVWLGGSCVARGRVPPVVGRPLAVCVWRQAGDYLAGTLLGSYPTTGRPAQSGGRHLVGQVFPRYQRARACLIGTREAKATWTWSASQPPMWAVAAVPSRLATTPA
jgi:hypothetical protein